MVSTLTTPGQHVCIYLQLLIIVGNEGGRRRLPSLPPNRSPRGSITATSTTTSSMPLGERGWIQMGVSFEESSLIVSIWAAKGLKMMETNKSMALPKPYALARLSVYG